MIKSKIILTDHNRNNLLKKLDEVPRLPGNLALHTRLIMDDYKDIIKDLLEENKKLKEKK